MGELSRSEQANLERHLAWTPQTFRTLVKHGVTPESPISLDVTFDAPHRRAAEALAAELRAHAFTAQAVSEGGGILRRGAWRVLASTPPTTVDEQWLLGWVRDLVHLGARFECAFDGWGAFAE